MRFNRAIRSTTPRARSGGGLRMLGSATGLIALTLLAGAACSGPARRVAPARAVMSEYQAWMIRITPTFDYAANRWHAAVQVWPPDRRPDALPGINVHYAATASDEREVMTGAMEAAQRYIDASRSQPER